MGRCKTHKTGSQWDLNEKPLVEDCVVMAVATHSPELTMLKQQEGKSGRVPSSLCFWGGGGVPLKSLHFGGYVSTCCGFSQHTRKRHVLRTK